MMVDGVVEAARATDDPGPPRLEHKRRNGGAGSGDWMATALAGDF